MQKVLIANRGEIAVRIIRAAQALGLKTVAIYAPEDEFSSHRFMADEAYLVGQGKSGAAAYLDIADIVAIAKANGVDAVHPGYGFLSENAEFVTALSKAAITFVGPTADHLTMFGDKIAAKQAAQAVNVPTIPGTKHPVSELAEALAIGEQYGYPLFVKSVAGGGGKGMRVVEAASELEDAFARAASEAKTSFGKPEIYLEKYLRDPRHIEVQILADQHGNLLHLFERDSSIQRRHQKIVEYAPAVSIEADLREAIQAAAVRLMDSVGYQSAATVEFLVDGADFYFIEVNPRIQVEHTVTEEVTGIDLVQSQFQIAMGYQLHDAPMQLPHQNELKAQGVAIQARITTEDPTKNFLPDAGTIQYYQAPAGPGIRVDGGTVYPGAVVTPYFDSLLLKVIAKGSDFEAARLKLAQALDTMTLTGVATNIPFLQTLVSLPVFIEKETRTTLIDQTNILSQVAEPQADPLHRVMQFIGETTVNGFPGVESNQKPVVSPTSMVEAVEVPNRTAKQVLDEQGADAVVDWVLAQEQVLLTDTSMRDAHQSLFATRMRTHDMLAGAEKTSTALPNLFSSEMWGGATFDTAYRFLNEDPWERLRQVRDKMPNTLTQMLFRGSNAVGYQNYPDNVLEEFIRLAAQNGMDVFRIFDSLNWLPQMEKSIQYVREQGKIAEATMAYTGDILDPTRTKYTLDYYVTLAKELEAAGAHMLAIKDMSALLKPEAAYRLVTELKSAVALPIHLHTHDTTGLGVATYTRAVEAGVDIIDVAMPALAARTSQPALGSVYYSLTGHVRQPELVMPAVEQVNDYWQSVVPAYRAFDNGVRSPQTDIFEVEMPGGQYSNLQQQAQGAQLGDRWPEIKRMYAAVNQLFGDIIKVTPSSKVVGDMALFMVQNELTPEMVLANEKPLAFPQSVIDFFQGELGQPVGGFPTELQRIILQGRAPLSERPGASKPPVDLTESANELAALLGHQPTPEEVMSHILYPKVFADYIAQQGQFGPVTLLDSPTFFYGLAVGEQVTLATAPGQTAVLELVSIGETVPATGERQLVFKLNGVPTVMAVRDQSVDLTTVAGRLADPKNQAEVGATMAGSVVASLVAVGDQVTVQQPLFITEAMKMETTIIAPTAGVVKEILVAPGQAVGSGELLLILE